MSDKDLFGNELAIIEPTPMALIQLGIQSGMDVGAMERLYALAERHEENEGRRAFGVAIASFQSDMPAIEKTRKADRFKYAGFDDIMLIAKPIASKHGICIGFDSDHGEGVIRVTCRLRVGSYHEDKSLTVPVSTKLAVSNTQQYGAALSYAKRYCLCAALNIVVTDEDNESKLEPQITEDHANEIDDLLKRSKSNAAQFLKYIERDSLVDMTERDYRIQRPILLNKIKLMKRADT